MFRKLRILISVITFSLATTVMADGLMQTQSLGSAQAACFVDTPAYDVLRPNGCFATGNSRTTTAVFGVLGVNQSSGQYTITYLDGTCEQIFPTGNEGLICTRTISWYSQLTQRVRVTDNYTSNSVILSATAIYEGLF